MSELRANTISDLAGTGPVALTGQSAAKAKAKTLAGAAPTGDLNVSSVTDVGTGVYTFNITNAFSDTGFAVLSGSDSRGSTVNISTGAVTNSTTSITSYTELSNGTPNDSNASLISMGDLA